MVLIFADGAQIRARICASVHVYAEGNEYAVTTAVSTVDVNSRFSRFQFSAFWLNGLASSIFIFALIVLRFFLLSSSMQELKYVVTDLILTCTKSYSSQKPPGLSKSAVLEVFRPYLDF